MLQELVKKLLYGSGALGLYHTVRNADTLTVAMFHRVLPPEDPRWAVCDTDYTISTALLAQTLDFFKRHYNVVSLAQVLANRRSGEALPPRALLITFDDGWSDNADHALPALQRAGLPALLFVVSDAVGSRQPFFQECIVSAWRRGVLGAAQLVAALDHSGNAEGLSGDASMPALRACISRLESIAPDDRRAVLDRFNAELDDGLSHMVDVADLQRLEQGGVALGLHGKSHTPMTRVPDLDVETSGARDALAQLMQRPQSPAAAMSFPHGSHDLAIAERVRDAGYELLFTSVPVLNPVGTGIGWLLGRTGFETRDVVDARGRFRPAQLALYMFRRGQQRLA